VVGGLVEEQQVGLLEQERQSATRRRSPPESVSTGRPPGAGAGRPSRARPTRSISQPLHASILSGARRLLLDELVHVVGVLGRDTPISSKRVSRYFTSADRILDLVAHRLGASSAAPAGGSRCGCRPRARLAEVLLVDPRHDAQQRALARAVDAEHADLGAGVEREPEALEHLLVEPDGGIWKTLRSVSQCIRLAARGARGAKTRNWLPRRARVLRARSRAVPRELAPGSERGRAREPRELRRRRRRGRAGRRGPGRGSRARRVPRRLRPPRGAALPGRARAGRGALGHLPLPRPPLRSPRAAEPGSAPRVRVAAGAALPAGARRVAFGFVFVCVEPSVPELDAWWGETPPWLERASTHACASAGGSSTQSPPTGSCCVENFQESHHFPHVHPSPRGAHPEALHERLVRRPLARRHDGARATTPRPCRDRRSSSHGRPFVARPDDRRPCPRRAARARAGSRACSRTTCSDLPARPALRRPHDDVIAEIYFHAARSPADPAVPRTCTLSGTAPTPRTAPSASAAARPRRLRRSTPARYARGGGRHARLRSPASQPSTRVLDRPPEERPHDARRCTASSAPYRPRAPARLGRRSRRIDARSRAASSRSRRRTPAAPQVDGRRRPVASWMTATRRHDHDRGDTDDELAEFLAPSPTTPARSTSRSPPAPFGDETDHPFTAGADALLTVRHGVYFPWKTCYHLLENDRWEDKHSGAGKDVRRRGGSGVPRDRRVHPRAAVTEVGRAVIFGLEANDHAPLHRDTEPGQVAGGRAERSRSTPRPGKRFYLQNAPTRPRSSTPARTGSTTWTTTASCRTRSSATPCGSTACSPRVRAGDRARTPAGQR
jgi:hypothetical protein